MDLTDKLIGRRAFLGATALTALAAQDLCAQDAKGIVAHWTADGGKPDELLDKSGKNNHAKLNGGKKIEDRIGNAKAMVAYLDEKATAMVPINDILTLSGKFTVEAILKFDSETPGRAIYASGDYGWIFYIQATHGGKGAPMLKLEQNRAALATHSINIGYEQNPLFKKGEYVHYAVTWDGEREHFFCNGKELEAQKLRIGKPFQSGTGNGIIGGAPTEQRATPCYLKEVRLHNYVLRPGKDKFLIDEKK